MQTGNLFFPLKPHVLQADESALLASVVSDSLRPRGDEGGKLLPELTYLSMRLARHREQTCDCQGRGGVGQDGLGALGFSSFKLSHTRWIRSKALPHSAGSSIQSPVIDHHGTEDAEIQREF